MLSSDNSFVIVFRTDGPVHYLLPFIFVTGEGHAVHTYTHIYIHCLYMGMCSNTNFPVQPLSEGSLRSPITY